MIANTMYLFKKYPHKISESTSKYNPFNNLQLKLNH